jgi:hypothetical protein
MDPYSYSALPVARLEDDQDDLGWVVVRDDGVMIAFGDGYMTERIANLRAAMLNRGRPGTDVANA